MEWRELSSSAIARVAYDEESRTLSVEFRMEGFTSTLIFLGMYTKSS
jgi:hypothetical protein